MIDVMMFPTGVLGTNTYVIKDKETDFIAIVDPGCEDRALTNYLDSIPKIKVRYILLTHGHFDHIGAAEFYKNRYEAKIIISSEDGDFLKDPDLNLSGMFVKPLEPFSADMYILDGDVLGLGRSKFSFMLTPGHTRGSGCFVFEEDGVIFSGDTLFFSSIGRTDFPTSDPVQMQNSLKKLASFTKDYTVYPGHNQITTLNREKENNPYLKY